MCLQESTVPAIVSREFLPKTSGHLKSFAAILNVDKRCAQRARRNKLAGSRSGPKPPAGRRFESSYTHHHVAFERRVWNAITELTTPVIATGKLPEAGFMRLQQFFFRRRGAGGDLPREMRGLLGAGSLMPHEVTAKAASYRNAGSSSVTDVNERPAVKETVDAACLGSLINVVFGKGQNRHLTWPRPECSS
jgi:hypothetical protein